jgi:phosphatidylglycerol---prolipoprotein diacylglyceryl transferase
MRRTLFIIPHALGDWPLFGWGLIFAALLVMGVVLFALKARDPRFMDDWFRHVMNWLLVMGVVVFVIPRIELQDVSGHPLGVAVRGYGMFLLLAVVAAVGLTIYRGKQRGFSEDFIFSLAPWVVIGGIVGARIFYVVQYWKEYVYLPTGELRDPLSMVTSALSFTSGGLVVYGSMIGGLIGGGIFCYRNRVSFLRLGDVIVPGLFLGVALGRIGCLMNGCCWGGACDERWAALHFPPGSPVYENQLVTGRLLGMALERSDESSATIKSVVPGSLADQAELKVGDPLRLQLVRERAPPETSTEDTTHTGITVLSKGREFHWASRQLPPRALPVMPAQPLSSLIGFSLCAILLFLDRWRRTDGILLATGFSMYAIARFFEEVVREDEPGRFGTSLSISQWISVFSLLFFASLAVWLWKKQAAAVAGETP